MPASRLQAWVSVTRLIAGLGGFREDTVPLNDGLNLAVNVGIVIGAVVFLRSDLKTREEDLEKAFGKKDEELVDEASPMS